MVDVSCFLKSFGASRPLVLWIYPNCSGLFLFSGVGEGNEYLLEENSTFLLKFCEREPSGGAINNYLHIYIIF